MRGADFGGSWASLFQANRVLGRAADKRRREISSNAGTEVQIRCIEAQEIMYLSPVIHCHTAGRNDRRAIKGWGGGGYAKRYLHEN